MNQQLQPETSQDDLGDRRPARQPIQDSPLPAESNPAATVGSPADWPAIIWRECCSTGDGTYARHLFELVADRPAGPMATVITTLAGAFYGSLLGWLAGLLRSVDQAGLPWLTYLGFGAILGGAVTLFIRLVLRRNQSWRGWLAGLTFNMVPHDLGLVGIGMAFVLFGGLVGWLFGLLAGLGRIMGIIMLAVLLLSSSGLVLVGWLIGLEQTGRSNDLHRYRWAWFWWRGRPRRQEVAAAWQQAVAESPSASTVWAEIGHRLADRKREVEPLQPLVAQIQSSDWVERVSAAHLLATAGGEAVELLLPMAANLNSSQHALALEVLKTAAQETRHFMTRGWCPRCLAFSGPHRVVVRSGVSLTYYGCRLCGQSRQLVAGKVVAVLDTAMTEVIETAEPVRVNWLARRELFDFDRVEIIRAGDEAVERFAVQIGNDTDETRRPRYATMKCVIGPACDLSKNTQRILERTFGVVEQKEVNG